MSYYQIPVSNAPATPSPNEGFVPYTIDSFGLGLQQLGGALSNDAAGIMDAAAGGLGIANPTNQAAAQAAIAADPSIIDPTSPNYQGAFIGPAGTAPGIGSEASTLASDIFGGTGSSLKTLLLIGVGIFLLAEFAPTINNLSERRR